MKRSGPIRSKSTRRRKADAATADLRALVASRPCLLRTVAAAGDCAGPGTPHHLCKASAGGLTTPENLVPLCAHHNSWVETEPELARRLGLVVRAGLDAAEAERRRRVNNLY